MEEQVVQILLVSGWHEVEDYEEQAEEQTRYEKYGTKTWTEELFKCHEIGTGFILAGPVSSVLAYRLKIPVV